MVDSNNSRVLRFPKVSVNGGASGISKTADFVLGQANFTSNLPGDGVGLARLTYPNQVKADRAGNIYVMEQNESVSPSRSRILKYGASAIQAAKSQGKITVLADSQLWPRPGDPVDTLWWGPTAMCLDDASNGLWISLSKGLCYF